MIKKSKISLISIIVVFALVLNIYISLGTKSLYAQKTPKQQACEFLGCPGGHQKCAEASGEISYPGIGKLSVKYFCYEP